MSKYSINYGRELHCPWLTVREWHFLSAIAESFYVAPSEFDIDYDKELEVQPATFDIEDIQFLFCKSESTIARYFKRLVDKGILTKTKRGKNAVYEFTGRNEMLRYMKLSDYYKRETGKAYSNENYKKYKELNEEFMAMIDFFRHLPKENRDEYLTKYEEKLGYPESLSFGFIEWVEDENGWRTKNSITIVDTDDFDFEEEI